MKLFKKRFHPCCGFFLEGAVKWICILNWGQIFIGTMLIVIDVFQRWERWQFERTNNYKDFTIRYSIWIAYAFHVISSIGFDIILYKTSRKRHCKGLMIWIICTFFSATYAGTIYYIHTFYFGLHIPTITIYNGYLFYRYYTLIVVYKFIQEIRELQQMNDAHRPLNDNELVEFVNGNPPPSNVNLTSGLNEAACQPYKKEAFEIPLEKLIIDELNPLGEGAYGKVFRAIYLNDDVEMTVAVKTVDEDNTDVLFFKALLSELKVMAYMGVHENVVSLIGACTSDIRIRKLFIVVEFCAYGSLLDFLRGCRGLFMSYVKDGQLMQKSKRRDTYSNFDGADAISTEDLVKWCFQIADGMNYLEYKKVIHGDLAARNVLLTAKKTVKITDFGLARQLYQYSVYVKRQNTPLPWRWLALESLRDMSFSSKSDVWAYGITAWEIFSLSEPPWPTQKFSLEFIENIKRGIRMTIPSSCTDDIYKLMLQCWHINPDERPSFTEISSFFKDIYKQLVNGGDENAL